MHRTLGPLAFTLALLFVAAPVTAATEDDATAVFEGQAVRLTIDVAPNAVIAELHDITIDGEVAAEARAAIDSLQGIGDADGFLAEPEVVSFETLISAKISQNLPSTFDHQLVTLDGHTPSTEDGSAAIQLLKVDIKGADDTSADSTAPILTDVKIQLRFDAADDTLATHSVDFRNVYGDLTGYAGSDAPPTEVHVRGWDAWSIVASSIDPTELQGRLSDDTLVLTNEDFSYFQSEGGRLAFDIQGDPDHRVDGHEEGAPAPGLALLLGGLGIAMTLLRRRD